MAFAISAPTISEKTTSQTQATTWTAISAGLALAATIPLAAILAKPVSQHMFLRGSAHDGNWGYVFAVIAVLLAPATYLLFFGTAGELLKTRVSTDVHRTTMRIAAIGMLPYLAMVMTAIYWQGGPQRSLMLTAATTIPIAMATTIWASGQSH